MKTKHSFLYSIVFAFICALLFGFGGAYASVNDFYFSDFTGDYYLTKDNEGVSHLRVVESVTAEFPEYKQNKGICRQISYTNSDGANITLPSLTTANLKLTRNGATEPIYSINKEAGYYEVCTGNDDYVLGTQVYKFEYEFEKVVTDFEKYQELYWDTNGNGATQRFDKVTARVHLEDMDWWTGRSWCYVGTYGESGKERCTTTKIADGVEFTASNLKAYENLTFDLELKPGEFVVPEPEKDYVYVILASIVGAAGLLFMGLSLRKFLKVRPKMQYYKGLFVKPEYQPHDKYGLTEMAEVYIGKKRDVKVAMLLEMVVRHKIGFQKVGKRKWKIIVKDLSDLGDEYLDLLAILNGGVKPEAGNDFELRSRAATSRLVLLKKSMEDEVVSKLKGDKLVEEKYKFGGGSYGVVSIIMSIITMLPIVFMLGAFTLIMLGDYLGAGGYGKQQVFRDESFIAIIVIVAVTVIVCVVLLSLAGRYGKHTEEGLAMSRYMDGLKMYIEMAEADRMKMLQSVEGADTSAEGIVKLYEKLLPYAAVFGLEESWMKEMKEYCRISEVMEPDYLMTGMAISDLTRTMRMASDIARTSTVMSSSGGSSSSGFSGGGGGGFSGGGGGGGGFSGR